MSDGDSRSVAIYAPEIHCDSPSDRIRARMKNQTGEEHFAHDSERNWHVPNRPAASRRHHNHTSTLDLFFIIRNAFPGVVLTNIPISYIGGAVSRQTAHGCTAGVVFLIRSFSPHSNAVCLGLSRLTAEVYGSSERRSTLDVFREYTEVERKQLINFSYLIDRPVGV